MAAFLGNLIGWLINRVLGSSGSGFEWEAKAALKGLFEALMSLATVLQGLAWENLRAWEFADRHVTGAAQGLADTSFASTYAWDRMLNVILPNSLSWLDGATHRWVDGKYDPILAATERVLERHRARLAALELEQNSFLIPGVRNYRGWREWFDTWPRGVVFTVHDWFMHPHDFATWATPILARPFVTYVGNPQHRQLRDDLLSTLLGGASDDAERLVAAAVTVLNEPVP